MLNPEEYEALTARIIDVVGEHTQNWVVIAEVPKDDMVHTICLWHGPINTAMGIVRRGQLRMEETARRHDFGEPPRGDLQKD